VKKATRPAGKPMRIPDLSFLSAGVKSSPKDKLITDREFFGPAWRDSPAAPLARLAAAEKALSIGAEFRPKEAGEPAEIRKIVAEELDALFGGLKGAEPDPAFQVLRPLFVGGEIRKARHLLGVLTRSLDKDYISPLATAAGTL